MKNSEEVKEANGDLAETEETQMVVLQRMDETLTHLDSVVQYGVSLLIIFMLVLLLN